LAAKLLEEFFVIMFNMTEHLLLELCASCVFVVFVRASVPESEFRAGLFDQNFAFVPIKAQDAIGAGNHWFPGLPSTKKINDFSQALEMADDPV
jgi:hypothetical protein